MNCYYSELTLYLPWANTKHNYYYVLLGMYSAIGYILKLLLNGISRKENTYLGKVTSPPKKKLHTTHEKYLINSAKQKNDREKELSQDIS